jgi:hypothetical protein
VFRVSEIEALAKALSALAARLEPKEAAHTCVQATEVLVEALAKTNPVYGPRLAVALSDLAGRLTPDEAAHACARAAAILADTPSWVYPYSLSALAARMEPKEAAHVCFLAAANHLKVMAMGKPEAVDPDSWAKGLSKGLSAVLARDLPPQTLVNLLKHPCCVGAARRLVLDQISRHYHRPFADQWDFVDYVQQQKLGLDLTTPPARSRLLP